MATEVLTVDKFTELAAAGNAPADVVLRVPTAVEMAEDDSREVLFTISTATVDRAGDTIAVDGWDLGAYRKNPVVLWVHNPRELPVARAQKVYAEGGALKSLAVFASAEMNPFAEQVYRMYQAKFLSAVSVGFNPLKWSYVDDKDRRGIDFSKQELLEYSCCPVPCNSEALMAAKAAGDAGADPLIEWAVGIIRTFAKPELKTVRDIEHFLRDVGGFSRSEAKAFAKPGHEAIQRDADAASTATSPDPSAIAALLETRSQILRRQTWQMAA